MNQRNKKLLEFLENAHHFEIDNFISKYFNGNYESFINFLKKQNLFDINDFRDPYGYVIFDMFPMDFFSYHYEKNPDQIISFIVKEYLSDVKVTNNRFYLELNEREDLSSFFEKNSQEIAEIVLKDDLDYTFFDVNLDDPYTEVIEELTPENLKILSQHISDELNDVGIEPETDLLIEIAEEQGHPDYVTITPEILLNEIFKDKNSTNYIIEEESDNVFSDLRSLYYVTYNNAYISEKYDQVVNQIKYLFEIDNIGGETVKEIKLNHLNGKVIRNYFWTIDATYLIKYLIGEMLNPKNISNYDSRNEFEYWGGVVELYRAMMDEDVVVGASINIPYYDYPDSDYVTEILNESFGSYF